MVAGERRRPAASSTDKMVMGPPRNGQLVPAPPYQAERARAATLAGVHRGTRDARALRRPSAVRSSSRCRTATACTAFVPLTAACRVLPEFVAPIPGQRPSPVDVLLGPPG